MINYLKKIDWAKVLIFILILFVYFSFLHYKMKIPAADDLPRQIKIGQEIVQGNFDILYKNTFSYTEPEYTFYNHHWLSGVAFYFIDTFFGWSGLSIFKLLILLLSFSIIFLSATKKANFWLVAIVSIPAILFLRERTGLRPEVFSYLFLSLYLYILLVFENNPKSKIIYWLVPLQLLWVNMHVFFSIGIMLTAGFLFEKIILNWGKLKGNILIKKLSIVFVLVVLVSFINPRGIPGVFYKYPTVSIGISEFQSLAITQRSGELNSDISVYIFKSFVLISVLSIAVYFYQRRRKGSFNINNKKNTESDSIHIPIFYILGLVATIILSFIIVRALALFGFMFLITVPHLLNSVFVSFCENIISVFSRSYKYIFGFIVITTVSLTFYFLYFSDTRFFNLSIERGVGAASSSFGGINFFKENNLKGPIFNDPDIGSYLIYHLYPKEKVFSDNRFGDAYSPKFWDDTYLPILADEEVWQENLKKYNFNTIFIYQYDSGDNFRQFMYNRMHDPEWAFVYGDTFSIIFVKNTPENKDIIDKYKITPENVEERLKYLRLSKVEDDVIAAADIFNMVGRLDLGRNTFLDVVIKRPTNGKIWMIMGEWELTSETLASSILGAMFLEKAINVGHRTSEAYSFLGLAYYRLGRYDKATEVLNKSLDINPLRADSKSLLNDINRQINK